MSIEEQVEDQFEDDQVDDEQETDQVDEEVATEEAETVDSDDDEVVVTIGEDSPPQEEDEGFNGQPAPQWVKDLRKENRELKKQLKTPAVDTPKDEKDLTLGEKPKLEQYGYDEDQYSQALDIWYDQKSKVDKLKIEREAEQQKAQEQMQAVVNSYNEKKQKLKVRDFAEAESEVTERFSFQQQGLILEGADDPALVVYALGKNKARLEELAKITNPAKFAFAVAKLETQMKTTKRKAATAPEKTVTGGGSTSGTTDTTLDRLRAEAEKTGDFTAVIRHKRKMKK